MIVIEALAGGGAIAGAIIAVLGVLLGAASVAVGRSGAGSRFVVLVGSLVAGAASIGAWVLAAGGRV